MNRHTFPIQVLPKLPPAIERLSELAANLWFSWHPQTRALFHRLDERLWHRTGANPSTFLRCVDQGILEQAAEDETFVSAYRKVLAEFDAYHEQGPAPYKAAELGVDDLIVYFCAEYGFHESFPIYSGGLGILAADHCKTASDMRLPFAAVGLLYRQGYFTQRIDRHGQQVPAYPSVEPPDTTLAIARDANGEEIRVGCPFPGRTVYARVWTAPVGRVPVALLDTDVEQNSEADRSVTRVLYGGDRALRLQQEVVLGIGGVRALRALGMEPAVWHINEGHAAFLVLERARELVERGLSFQVALEAIAASTVYTTHTPVSAGHDVFAPELVAEHFADYLRELGLTSEAFIALGRGAGSDEFNMTRLALRGAGAVNGVSLIHGRVSSELCHDAWPEVPPEENPVGYITNGVHVPTFMRQAWMDLLEQHLGPAWRQQLMDRTLFQKILDIPDERFWYTKQQVKSEMLHVLRQQLTHQYTRNKLSEAHIHRLLKRVDPNELDVLTVGFARRFATYKRSTLLFSDLAWLESLLDNGERPVLFLFAGKAHPADEPAQHMMREIQRISSQPPFLGKILLVEGYDIGLGRLLSSGVDVWLNTPVHPFEASGTSGMKAAINGTVNLSVLDGWWAEAYDGTNGWGIPPSVGEQGAEDRDRQDAVTLYEILQDDVVPLYHARDTKLGYSPQWVELCKRSMASVLPNFNSQRVVHDYARCFYGPAAKRGREIAQDDYAAAKHLSAWKEQVRAAWPELRLESVATAPPELGFGEPVVVEVDVHLAGLRPEHVRVECVLRPQMCSELTVPIRTYAEPRRSGSGIAYIGDEPQMIMEFTPQPDGAADRCRYRLQFKPPWAGASSYQIRAVPQHAHLRHPYEVGLMRWL